MPSEAKTFAPAALKLAHRDPSAALGMTACCIAILIASGSLGRISAQETPMPSAAPSPSPVARTVRISFIPPPLEGTISLGIYNKDDQLVRVLHQEAELDEFEIGADALTGHWDGKDDEGHDLPAGRYHAKGLVVAPTKIEEVKWDDPGQTEMPNSVRVKLVANPLENNERPVIELAVGFDDENAFLKAADGLPVVTIWRTGDTTRAWISQRADKSLDVFLDYGASTRQLHVIGISRMMAFDCGVFNLK